MLYTPYFDYNLYMGFFLFIVQFHYFSRARTYGIDWDGPVGVHLDAERVEVPNTPNSLNAEQMDELRELVNPLAPGDNLGISLYARST